MSVQGGQGLRNRESGFSLIEVTVALAILGIALVAILQLLAATTSLAARGEESMRALQLQLARSQLEAIKQSPFQPDPANYPAISAVPEGFSVQFSVTDVGTTYSYPPPDGSSLTNVVHEITVQVTGQFGTMTLQGYKVTP